MNLYLYYKLVLINISINFKDDLRYNYGCKKN